jgi:hypothetical protein
MVPFSPCRGEDEARRIEGTKVPDRRSPRAHTNSTVARCPRIICETSVAREVGKGRAVQMNWGILLRFVAREKNAEQVRQRTEVRPSGRRLSFAPMGAVDRPCCASTAWQRPPSAGLFISVVDDYPVFAPTRIEHVDDTGWRLLHASHAI